jgi:hypothetical protein
MQQDNHTVAIMAATLKANCKSVYVHPMRQYALMAWELLEAVKQEGDEREIEEMGYSNPVLIPLRLRKSQIQRNERNVRRTQPGD